LRIPSTTNLLAVETEREKDIGRILARPAILNVISVEAAIRSQAAAKKDLFRWSGCQHTPQHFGQ
jgi:hypothetical protein